jgi:CRISPR-associated protein Cas1
VILGEQSRLISPDKITSIAVLGNAQLSSAALRLAAESGVPIYIYHPNHGKIASKMDSPYFHNLAAVRRQQVFFAVDVAATQWIISLFEFKTQFQNDNLKFLQNRKPQLSKTITQTIQNSEKWLLAFKKVEKILLEDARPHIMGIEGTIAKEYWALIGAFFNDPAIFGGRNRRPALDTFNVALNYAYGMLYNVVEQACFAAGLDPQLGFLHVDDYAKPTLVFDIIEPFRAWIDRLLLELFLKTLVLDAFFEPLETGGMSLSQKGKNGLIPAVNEFLNERTHFNQKRLTRQTPIFRFAGLFVHQLKIYKFKKECYLNKPLLLCMTLQKIVSEAKLQIASLQWAWSVYNFLFSWEPLKLKKCILLFGGFKKK